MKHISLEEMFEILTNCILNKVEQPSFYFKNQYGYQEITEVDLMRGRFITANDDFSEFEWELSESNIYVEEDLWKK